MTKGDKTERFLDAITTVTHLQLNALASFEKRFLTLAEHRQLVIGQLLPLSRKLAPGRDQKRLEDIRSLTERILVNIISNFNAILKDLHDLNETATQSGQLTASMERLFEHDFRELRRLYLDPHLSTTAVKAKLEEITNNLSKAISKETETASLEEYIINILRKQQRLIEQQRTALNAELDALTTYRNTKTLDEQSIPAIRLSETTLQTSVRALDSLLREERRDIMEPLNHLLKQKLKASEEIKSLISEKKGLLARQNTITEKDLKTDIMRLSRAEDVLRYLNAIAPLYPYLDKKAQRFHGKASALAASAAKDQRIDLARKAETAIIDALTGVYNRRYFDEFILRKILEAERYKRPFTMLLIDLDNFKSFNSSYELTGGDIVLRDIAAFLKRSLRATDYIFRYGGEEFAIIFTETTPDRALPAAEKIRTDLVEESTTLMEGLNADIKLQDAEEREPWNIKKEEVEKRFRIKHISFSGGLVGFEPDSGLDQKTAATELTKKASELVKTSKEQGRNRITTA